MRTKPIYKCRVGDKIFVVYRLSNYARESIQAMAAGLAYNKMGNYSDDFIRSAKRYGIDLTREWSEVCKDVDTSDTHAEFCSRIYLYNHRATGKIPSKSMEICERYFNSKRKDKQQDRRSYLEFVIKQLKDDGHEVTKGMKEKMMEISKFPL